MHWYSKMLPKNSLYCFIVLMTVLTLNQSDSVFAEMTMRVETASSPNPVGSGARAMGMGGAFIAVADDATAASWNPGGLVQLERPEISAVGAGFHRIEDLSFGERYRASDNKQTVSDVNLNYLSAVYPFTAFDRNMVVSLSYQHLFNFSRDWSFTVRQDNGSTKVDHQQDGNLYALGFSYCIQIIPQLTFGFTLNMWEDGIYRNQWEREISNTSTIVMPSGATFTVRTTHQDRYSFSGFNANVGLLWRITDKLTAGAVFKTPFTADLDHRFHFINVMDPFPPNISTIKTDEKLDMPMSYGIGLAYRFSDKLTVSTDVYRTEWQDFILTDASGRKISLVSGLLKEESDIDPTTQVRAGAEYLLIKPKYTIPLRAGAFYDPAPSEGSPDNYYGFSLGSGITLGRFAFDIAYQYRFGRDVGASFMNKEMDFSEDLDEHTFYSSLIIHF